MADPFIQQIASKLSWAFKNVNISAIVGYKGQDTITFVVELTYQEAQSLSDILEGKRAIATYHREGTSNV